MPQGLGRLYASWGDLNRALVTENLTACIVLMSMPVLSCRLFACTCLEGWVFDKRDSLLSNTMSESIVQQQVSCFFPGCLSCSLPRSLFPSSVRESVTVQRLCR